MVLRSLVVILVLTSVDARAGDDDCRGIVDFLLPLQYATAVMKPDELPGMMDGTKPDGIVECARRLTRRLRAGDVTLPTSAEVDSAMRRIARQYGVDDFEEQDIERSPAQLARLIDGLVATYGDLAAGDSRSFRRSEIYEMGASVQRNIRMLPPEVGPVVQAIGIKSNV